MVDENIRISKFLSYILRHRPESIGLTLDPQGWASIPELICKAEKKGIIITPELIVSVVQNNDKKRFTISEDHLKIRAVQGHSIKEIEINYEKQQPPQYLYHGTATKFVRSILKTGIQPKTRQYVHLSVDQQTALTVGQPHGEPVILKIDALKMFKDGYHFYLADNGVWLTSNVPPMYFSIIQNKEK